LEMIIRVVIFIVFSVGVFKYAATPIKDIPLWMYLCVAIMLMVWKR